MWSEAKTGLPEKAFGKGERWFCVEQAAVSAG
jgi:hypothetical protein